MRPVVYSKPYIFYNIYYHGDKQIFIGCRKGLKARPRSALCSLVSSHWEGLWGQRGIYPQYSMKWKNVMKHTNAHAPGWFRNHNFSNHHYQYYYINVPGHRLVNSAAAASKQNSETLIPKLWSAERNGSRASIYLPSESDENSAKRATFWMYYINVLLTQKSTNLHKEHSYTEKIGCDDRVILI